MLPLSKLIEIQDFALHNGFDVQIIPDDDVITFSMKIEYGDREIKYRGCDDAVIITDIMFSGNFESFVAEMNLLRIIEKIGVMIYEALGKEV